MMMPMLHPMRTNVDATSWIIQWYLKDFARPERIARRPRDIARKDQEVIAPWIEARLKMLCVWCLGLGGVEILVSEI